MEPGTSVWEALAGRAPGRPLGPADRDIYEAVLERLNPAKARPVFRAGVEEAHLTSLRGEPYVMLRSLDRQAAYVRLHPDEVELAHLMDGTRSVASLIAEFARITGRLAPSQVLRVVADLAGNRMLTELPVDAFHPLDAVGRRPLPLRFGHRLLQVAKGNRFTLFNVDRLAGILYRSGGRLFFTSPAAVLMVAAAAAGAGIFATWWARGAQQAFLVGNSYAVGGLTLLGLNVVCLVAHELGHALAAKHAGRRVPAAGVLLYFGIPSVFVDTTDVWMAGRRARILTSAAGPGASLAMAGAVNLAGLAVPEFAPLAFKLSFLWYTNALFNLNPLLALDGYYLLMDWLEIPNLRSRGIGTFFINLRRRRLGWRGVRGEDRLIAMYGTAAGLWIAFSILLMIRAWKDRVSGLTAGLWYAGWPSRIGLIAFVSLLVHPLAYLGVRSIFRVLEGFRRRMKERARHADEPRRFAVISSSALRTLPAEALAMIAREARWARPRSGAAVIPQNSPPPGLLVVVEGSLEARRDGDPGGSIRARAAAGELAGATAVLRGVESQLTWTAVDAVLLVVPSATFLRAVGDRAPRVGPEAGEAEALLELPIFGSLTESERSAITSTMRPLDLTPQQSITLQDPDTALVVAAGIVQVRDDEERRPGELIGPPANGAIRAVARTPARLWALPASAGFRSIPGGSWVVRSSPGRGAGMHSDTSLALTSPWGSPPRGGHDERTDDRLAGWFRRLIVLLLLMGILAFLVALEPGVGWSELPGDRVLVSVEGVRVDVVTTGDSFTLGRGERAAVGEGASISVHDRSRALLTFRGGGRATLCAASVATLNRVLTTGPEPFEPAADLSLRSGTVILDTESRSEAFEPLFLRVETGGHEVANTGIARFATGGATVAVAKGTVSIDGITVGASTTSLSCGTLRPADGSAKPIDPTTPTTSTSRGALLAPPAGAFGESTSAGGGQATVAPSPSPTLPSLSPSPSAAPSLSPSPSPTPQPTFSVSCSPSSIQASPGAVRSSLCTVTSTGGFDNSVKMTCSIDASVGSCSMSPQTVTPPADGEADSTMTLLVDPAAAPGCYAVTVAGTWPGLKSRTTTIQLDIVDGNGQGSC